MIRILLFLFPFVFSLTLQASPSYITAGLVELAIQNVLNDNTAGIGAKSNSCLLCHASTAGGPGNINQFFGRDYQLTAIDNGFNPGSNLTLVQLEVVFADTEFLDRDSDADGESNRAEFLADEDPADNVTNGSTGGDSGGGGCGTITTKGGTPGPGPFLLILPFLFLLLPRRAVHRIEI